MKIRNILKKIYRIISVISTMTIFSGIVIFIFGFVLHNNESDNDLAMKQIESQLGDCSIIGIDVSDIHCFGYNSIIVTASNSNSISYDSDRHNKLIIMDTVNNDILYGMNDLLGLKSRYKITFLDEIQSDKIRFYPITDKIFDIIDDTTKELIVKYYVWGSTYNANGVAIYKYFYDDAEYRMIGSYPECKKLDLTKKDENGNVIIRKAQEITTDFNNVSNKNINGIKCCSKEKQFILTVSSDYERDYWIKANTWGNLLVQVKTEKFTNGAIINCYIPMYYDEELTWNAIASEEVENITWNYTKEDLKNVLTNMLECEFSFY